MRWARGVLWGALAAAAGALSLAASAGETKQDLAGKKAVLIIGSKGFRDEELLEPSAILKARGCKVTIACSSLETATGMLDAKVKPDALLKDVRADDYDAIVFIGGTGAKEYFDDATAHALAREAVAKDKLLAAICIAPSILARAGVLMGKHATAWRSQKLDLSHRGARWLSAPVVRDGKILTANGPEAAERFGQTLADALARGK